jgi:hypothetical protein
VPDGAKPVDGSLPPAAELTAELADGSVAVLFWKGAPEVSGVGTMLPDGAAPLDPAEGSVMFWKGAPEVSGVGPTLPDGARLLAPAVGLVTFWKGAPEVFGDGTTLPEGRKPADAIGADVSREQGGIVKVGPGTPGHEV